ncbi:MAG: NADPH:quinone reductase-like Zn-dependent oxidoreductase [Candidatus Latescibacterota bacterium]|jgi:NADPH:quinone reductase-like Zn-dependent oxidoreductase
MNRKLEKKKIMKAYVLSKAGSIENLILREIEQPSPKAGEVLVEVKAVSINPVDVKVRPTE